ncbi:MFS general substrate transporter [Cubamyces sp. BRFM 1775]|nr:MFS general substrate transporter [Cubamyces sp. BRFM 1775]
MPATRTNDVDDIATVCEPPTPTDAGSLTENGQEANAPVPPSANANAPEPPPKPYSVFTRSEKWFIVAVTGFGALFSPLTTNIYFPAIPTIGSAFNKSVELINLTVTVYMVLQGICERPMFIGCMVVLTLSCVGLALVPTNAYWLLMLLRCLQAAGSASTIALGAGVITDIAASAERGTFFGIWNIGPMVGPSVGPVIGGVLSDRLGWRSIFWFLCIAAGVCTIIMALFLPETLRALVGNGSIPPPKSYMPLVPVLGRTFKDVDESDRPPRRAFANPFILFTYLDVSLLLFLNGLIYAVFYGVTATISTLFQPTYPYLTETDIGLCFLAIGGGMSIGGVVTGKIFDREYQRVKRRLLRQIEADPESIIRPEDVTKEEHFPIEYARLRLMPLFFTLYAASCIGYGWCLQARVSIAGPLVLQFIIGWTCISILNGTQTLIVDLAPSHGSAITACNNLVRCSLGAGCVSVIDLIIKAIGTGWTYVLLTGICILFSPIYFILMRYGPVLRARRRAKRQATTQAATDRK